MSTTLTELEIGFVNYDRSHRDNRRTAQPICECLAHLRREHHPLRKLELSCICGGDDGQLIDHAIQLINAILKSIISGLP